MGYMNSYAYFMPIHYLYQIVSINLCHNYVILAIPLCMC